MSVGDMADSVTAGIAALAFGAAVWEVRSAKHSAAQTLAQGEEQTRQQRTIAYVSKLSDAEFMKRLAHTSEQLSAPTGEDTGEQRWEAYKALPIADQFDIAAPLNLFEEIGTLYNLGLLDDALVDRQLAHAARVLWERFAWWIELARRQDSRRFCEWEQMLDTLDAPASSAS